MPCLSRASLARRRNEGSRPREVRESTRRDASKVHSTAYAVRLRAEPMVVRVLYFAGLREALGLAEEAIDVPAGIRTVGDLSAHLAARHAAYAERRKHVRVARNEAFAHEDETLRDGDVIGLIPPVAGG
jgi:molybdopterin synthase sulfur carrier subunit